MIQVFCQVRMLTSSFAIEHAARDVIYFAFVDFGDI